MQCMYIWYVLWNICTVVHAWNRIGGAREGQNLQNKRLEKVRHDQEVLWKEQYYENQNLESEDEFGKGILFLLLPRKGIHAHKAIGPLLG